jgi:hypothetical protein
LVDLVRTKPSQAVFEYVRERRAVAGKLTLERVRRRSDAADTLGRVVPYERADLAAAACPRPIAYGDYGHRDS